MPDNWLQIDEKTDVLISLEEVIHQINRIADPVAWKWASIALVSAINSALVCNLSGTAGHGALRERDATETLAALQNDSDKKFPSPFLANTTEMLERASGRSKRLESAGGDIELDDEEFEKLKKLLVLRNEFLHFKNHSWFIETSGMPDLVRVGLNVIIKISADSWSFRHMTVDDHFRFHEITNRISSWLDRQAAI